MLGAITTSKAKYLLIPFELGLAMLPRGDQGIP